MSDVITVRVTCRSCKDGYDIEAREAHLIAWKTGALIQDVLSYLTVDERELLISQTCNKCFFDMFPLDENTQSGIAEPYCGDCLKPVSLCHHNKGE